MIGQRTGTGIPPWSLAILAMLLVQLSNALSVGVIEHVGSAGTAWLRMCFGAVLLLLLVWWSRRVARATAPPEVVPDEAVAAA